MDTNYMNEVEKLARTLRTNKVAQTEGEARRMAEEMLATSKKVHDDFKARDQQMYSQQPKSTEMENAHKLMEKISANLAKGAGGRVNVSELDLNRPLKELVMPEPTVTEVEEDDAIVVNDESVKAVVEEAPSVDVAVAQVSEAAKPADPDEDTDDDDDDGSEEERAEADDEFSVKEL